MITTVIKGRMDTSLIHNLEVLLNRSLVLRFY